MPPAAKTHLRGPCGSATGDPLCSLSSASAKRSASSTKNSSLSSKASKLQEALLSVARLLPTKTTTRSSSKSARLSRRSDSRRSSPPNITIIVNHRSASASPPRSSDLPGAPPPAATHAGTPRTRTVAAPPAVQLAANDLRRLLHQLLHQRCIADATTPSLHPRLQWTANIFSTPPFLRPEFIGLRRSFDASCSKFRIVFVDPLVYQRGPSTFPYPCACMFPLACKWWATR